MSVALPSIVRISGSRVQLQLDTPIYYASCYKYYEFDELHPDIAHFELTSTLKKM